MSKNLLPFLAVACLAGCGVRIETSIQPYANLSPAVVDGEVLRDDFVSVYEYSTSFNPSAEPGAPENPLVKAPDPKLAPEPESTFSVEPVEDPIDSSVVVSSFDESAETPEVAEEFNPGAFDEEPMEAPVESEVLKTKAPAPKSAEPVAASSFDTEEEATAQPFASSDFSPGQFDEEEETQVEGFEPGRFDVEEEDDLPFRFLETVKSNTTSRSVLLTDPVACAPCRRLEPLAGEVKVSEQGDNFEIYHVSLSQHSSLPKLLLVSNDNMVVREANGYDEIVGVFREGWHKYGVTVTPRQFMYEDSRPKEVAFALNGSREDAVAEFIKLVGKATSGEPVEIAEGFTLESPPRGGVRWDRSSRRFVFSFDPPHTLKRKIGPVPVTVKLRGAAVGTDGITLSVSGDIER